MKTPWGVPGQLLRCLPLPSGAMSAVVAGCDVVSGWVVHTASDSTAREWSAVWLFANELSGHGFNILVFHPPLILMALAALRSVAV